MDTGRRKSKETHADSRRRCEARSARRLRVGLTLVELIMAIGITSLLSVVLGGIVMAVETARDHAQGLESATMQATAACRRIEFMASRAGIYRLPGEPAVAGLAVVWRDEGTVKLPEVLVVWSGGREGGMAGEGVQDRLPRIDELVIYAPDPADSRRLVEVVVPTDSSSIDFRDSGFDEQILSLIDSPAAEPVLLCDRVRRSTLPGTTGEAANVRFELTVTPDDDQLAATTPGSAEWYDLPWAQSIVSSDSGMRQATLRAELQLQRRAADAPANQQGAAAVPFFGSASYRYAYSP